MNDATFIKHLTGKHKRLGAFAGATLDVCLYHLSDKRPHDNWIITRIFVPADHREQGHGSDLMQRICTDADEQGITLWLEPAPYDDSIDYDRLVAFYTCHGFTSPQYGIMRRKPRSIV